MKMIYNIEYKIYIYIKIVYIDTIKRSWIYRLLYKIRKDQIS